MGLTISADDLRSKPLPQRVQFDPRSGKESRSSEVMEPRSLPIVYIVVNFQKAFKGFLKPFPPGKSLPVVWPLLGLSRMLRSQTSLFAA